MKFETFLINLKRSPDRLAHMSRQLKEIDMPFTLFEGIDGKTYDFTNDYDDTLSKEKNGGKGMTRGHIGCSLSHKKLFEKIVAENIDYAFVMEDDIDLPKDLKKIVEREVLKRDSHITTWEYLSFSYPPVGFEAIALWWAAFARMTKDNKQNKTYWLKFPIYLTKFLIIAPFYLFEGIREKLYAKFYQYGKAAHFYRPLYLTGCYLVSKEGAQKLLAVNDKVIYVADRLPNVARVKTGLKFFAFVPRIIRQRDDFESQTK